MGDRGPQALLPAIAGNPKSQSQIIKDIERSSSAIYLINFKI